MFAFEHQASGVNSRSEAAAIWSARSSSNPAKRRRKNRRAVPRGVRCRLRSGEAPTTQ